MPTVSTFGVASRRFAKERGDLVMKLRGFPGVQAVGYGVKFTDSTNTGVPCVSIFVRKKHPKSRLSRSLRIDPELKIGKALVKTDVIAFDRMKRQSAPTGYPVGDCLNDGLHSGTRSAYVETHRGIEALTCAHVVTGHDADPMTPDAISSFDWSTYSWVDFGWSERAVFDSGSGAPDDFGYIDSALVSILPGVMSQIDISPTPKAFFSPRSLKDVVDLRGTTVCAFGVASGSCTGIIQAVLVSGVDNSPFKADLVIAASDGSGLTREGDSGMLWQTQEGTLIGQHALGRVEPAGEASRLTIGTLLYRIKAKLGIISFR